ncbi:hypothetical protein Y717_13875 [Streptomyces scopuliridis RB72]|uniref:Novel STAND NTPase 1 domain-containing protein n=1 Tax=Streptomyces scopuliridis RB72 TaxID=1440053 RepID=A0A2T7SMN1_9ACTN|nr:hypothetical protein Y717_13875 [Streptomyces scopuliridis RB72]
MRILSADGEVIGAGFLVAADVVCTCAHVVTGALGVPDTEESAPGTPVDLDFPLLSGRPRARATVVSWRGGGADVALLRLDAAVEGARPVPLVDGTGVWGHTFRALGYPDGADDGVWASGTLRAGQGAGWVQMEAQEPGPRIEEGFSGAPVWDDAQDGVVGMTVAAHLGERTAYLLPSAELVDERTLRPRCPFQGLAPFTEADAEFFHGREGDTARVHTAVRRRPVTLVAGPSGCGKSSLVRAGVLPRLRAEGMSVSELRPVPGVRAAAVLARALTGILEPELGEVERLARAEELAGLLETGGDVPAELRGGVLARGASAGHVIFVDQFEEYAGAEPAAARGLFGLLAALAGGGLTVLVPVGTTLMAVRAESVGGERFRADSGKYSVSPNGRFVALVTDRRLEVLDASRTRHQSVSLPPPAETVDWIPTWTADSKRIVVWGESGNLYRSYSVQDLRDSVPLDDVVPKAKELDSVTELRGGEVDSVAALQGSEIVLLTVDGRLARVDAADAAVRTRRFLVHPAPNWAGTGLTGEIFVRSQLIARPGHPGQVAAVTRTGTQRGEILLWDVWSQRRVTTLPGPAISVPFATDSFTSALAFDADGSHLAVQNVDGQVMVWDVDRRKQLARSAPRASNDALVGIGSGDSVVTYLSDKKQVQFYDLTGDGASGTLPVAGGNWIAGFVHGHRLTIDTGRLRQTFDLNPDTQFRTLCAAADRDYTEAERKLLPEGTPSQPPCS